MPDLEQVDVRHGGQQLHVIELVRALRVPPRLVTGGGESCCKEQRTEKGAQNISGAKCKECTDCKECKECKVKMEKCTVLAAESNNCVQGQVISSSDY